MENDEDWEEYTNDISSLTLAELVAFKKWEIKNGGFGKCQIHRCGPAYDSGHYFKSAKEKRYEMNAKSQRLRDFDDDPLLYVTLRYKQEKNEMFVCNNCIAKYVNKNIIIVQQTHIHKLILFTLSHYLPDDTINIIKAYYHQLIREYVDKLVYSSLNFSSMIMYGKDIGKMFINAVPYAY